MKELKIEWLDSCPKCDASVHTVHTKDGSEKWLYDGDKVICDCGQAGEIECDDGVGFELNAQEVDLTYEVFSDYVERNEVKGVDVKLPFTILQSLGEVS